MAEQRNLSLEEKKRGGRKHPRILAVIKTAYQNAE